MMARIAKLNMRPKRVAQVKHVTQMTHFESFFYG
jgi:hypothetical protein